MPAKPDKQACRLRHVVAGDRAWDLAEQGTADLAASLTSWQSRATTERSHDTSFRQLLRSL